MVGQDLSQEHAWQLSQELRLASNFSGPFNFSVGTNYMHYETVEDYYVFFNLITAELQEIDGQDAGQYTECNSGTSFLPPSLIHPNRFSSLSGGVPQLGLPRWAATVSWWMGDCPAPISIPIRSARSTDWGITISAAKIPMR